MISTIPGFARHLFSTAPVAMTMALLSLWLASLTEGVSVLLLVPILRLLGPSQHLVTINAPAYLARQPIVIGLGEILMFFVAVVTLRAWLMRKKDIFNAILLYDYTNGLRGRLFAAVARSKWAFLAQLRGSDINHALTADIDRVTTAVAQFLQIIQTIVLIAIYLMVSLFISPVLTIFCGTAGILIVAMLSPLRRMALRYGATLTSQRQSQYRIVSEFVAGLKLAKSSNAEDVFIDDFSHTLRSMRDGTVKFVRLYSLGGVFFQIATSAGLAIFVYAGIMAFSMQASAILALVVVFSRIAPRFGAVHGAMQDVLTNLPALNAMLKLQRSSLNAVESSGIDNEIQPLVDAVEFSHVRFAYAAAEALPVLKDATFRIPAGCITALVGPSGSGKSTIADLLMGLLECDSGAILVDGIPLEPANRRAWREALAYVPQDSFMLHDSIRANLGFGGSTASEERLWAALRAANAEGFVRSLPEGLETIVGDRGLKLSGGERQRVAIARALLRTPSLLVLDEATSALDWENQAMIASVIEGLRGKVTVVTIAHRPSMIAFADWVVAVDGGRIVETGQYAQLAADPTSHLSAILNGDR